MNTFLYETVIQFIFFFNFLMFISETETEHEWGWGREREGDTESEAGSSLWAVSTEPDAGLELTDREIVTWAEVGRLTDRATQVPQQCVFLKSEDVISYNHGIIIKIRKNNTDTVFFSNL